MTKAINICNNDIASSKKMNMNMNKYYVEDIEINIQHLLCFN